jgi:hypothetical protein
MVEEPGPAADTQGQRRHDQYEHDPRPRPATGPPPKRSRPSTAPHGAGSCASCVVSLAERSSHGSQLSDVGVLVRAAEIFQVTLGDASEPFSSYFVARARPYRL